jgi:hypothetical protein
MNVRVAALLVFAGWAIAAHAACPTQAPQLNSPANGAVSVASPVQFDWDDVSRADSYRVWASFNSGTANIIALTRDSQVSVSVPSGLIEWWVEALGDNCPTSTASAHFRFTAAGGSASCPLNPSSPTLLTPANGATGLASPVQLSWSAVPNATGYRVFAQVNGAPAVVVATTTSTQMSAPFPAASVIWFVEAQFGSCPSTFSRFGTFTVTTGTSCTGNAPGTLTSPANGATVTSPVTFKWNAVPGAIGYKLFIGSSAATADLAGITTDTTLTRLVGEGTSTWYVDTMFAGCPDQHSAEFRFTVPPSNTCSGSITLVAPAENATVASPATLTWTPIPNATAYRVWVSVDGSAPTILARTTNTTQALTMPSGSVAWFVEALFASCPSILSPTGHFTVGRASNCSNNPPVLTSPIGGAQVQSPVTFNWSGATSAMLFRVWISVNGAPFEDVGITKASQLQADVPGGTVQWYVEAFFAGCPSVNSQTATFTIPQPAGCANGTSLLLSPPDGSNSVTAPVTLVWSAVQNATNYRVFATFNGSGPQVIARTSGTSITKPLPPGSISWWVEAEFDSCASTRSLHSDFVIPRAANCGTDVPQLVAPANGANNVSSPVKLDWNPVSAAVDYVVFIRHNGGAITPIGESTNSDLTKRLPEGSFEWWVVAFFAGCPPVQSQHATFTIPPATCSNRAPILMGPIDGATGLTSPVHMTWAPVPKATGYKVWASIDDQDPSVVATTTTNRVTATMPSGETDWFVEADFANCPPATSETFGFTVRKNAPACGTPEKPVARAPGQVATGTPFTIHWSPVANATNYELLESTAANFNGATTTVISDVSATLTRTAASAPVRYYYRVRAISNCSDDKGAYSKIISVVVMPPQGNAQRQTSVDVGVQSGVTQQLVIPGQNPPVNFSAKGDKPWITVTPATGTIGPQGITLTVTSDPSALKLGTNTGTVIITTGSSGNVQLNGVVPNIPVSVSLVTPVTPAGKNGPPPDSLIIPAVGHAPGVNNALFESDVRVANVSATTQSYQLNFTLTGTDGTQSGQSTTISIDPGATMALDDILANFFGIGSDATAATGVLEVRPLTSSTSTLTTTATPSVQTVASSRTFNTTANGTFGQFIPAIPFSQFVGQSSILSLQQIAQSSAYRTNLGLVEAAGEPASVLIHVIDNSGHELARVPQNLLPGEHLQINNFLQVNGISLTDGRLEVEVTSSTGKVTAYASVVDNVTNDPLLVSPVLKGSVSDQRYVMPGVADLNTGFASWRTDMRIFNSGTSPATATLAYFPQAGSPGASNTAQFTIQPGQVQAIDNAMQTLYGLTNTGGSILVTTPANSSLVVTGRTYDQTSNGTFGQFVPAVTPKQAVGSGEQPLNLLQLESSDRYRTNIGLAETSGNAATAHVSLVVPDSKVAISTDIPMAPNQFVQFSLASFGLGTVYNGRVTVSVTGGTGRVTAYGSVIDQLTQDPTYVPAQ